MGKIIAYFDESGTHAGSRITVFGGFVASDEEWSKFNEQWTELLNDYRLSYFRMSECENLLGGFKRFTKTKQQELLRRVLSIVTSRQLTGVGVGIVVNEYNEFLAQMKLSHYLDAYSTAAFSSFARIRKWADESNYHEPVEFVLENGAEHKGKVIAMQSTINGTPQLRERFRLGSLTFAEKRQSLQLQAADLLAYEIRKHALNLLEGSPRQARYTFLNLKRMPLIEIYINRSNMMNLVRLAVMEALRTGVATVKSVKVEFE